MIIIIEPPKDEKIPIGWSELSMQERKWKFAEFLEWWFKAYAKQVEWMI